VLHALFIWKGEIFRVSISTLLAPKARGGWGLIDVYNKRKALLYCRMLYQSTRNETATATWLQEWNLQAPLPNPPNVALYQPTTIYTRMYGMDMAYIRPPSHNDTPKLFRKVYTSCNTQWQLRHSQQRAREYKQNIPTKTDHRSGEIYTTFEYRKRYFPNRTL